MGLYNTKFKKSNFCFLLPNKLSYYATYHSLSCEVIYGGKLLRDIFNHFSKYNTVNNFFKKNKISNSNKVQKLFRMLSNKGFLIKADTEDAKKLYDLQRQVENKNFIKTLYLSLTYKCNFNCKYCISNNSVAIVKGNKISDLDMSRKIAKLAADYYLRAVKKDGDKEVVFYGGEPLLNFGILKFLVNYINKKEKLKIFRNKKYKKTRFILCTNGSLFNQKAAIFIKKNKIYPAVTFDGDEKTHNQVRMYKNKKGTYTDVLKKYKLLQKLNFPIGVTLTLGRHNIGKLPEFVALFSKKFKPHTMATNIMVDYEGGGNKYVCKGSILAGKLIDAFKVARKEGLYLVKYVMDNRVKPFVEQMPRLKGCTGSGSRIMVLPDGSLSACMAYAKKSKVNILNDPKIKDFIPSGIDRYSPFLKDQCQSCLAISCCGGGCPKSAEVKHGNFLTGLDDEYCIQSKKFLEWLIWDLFNFLEKNKIYKDGFVCPSIKDRRKIYGNIRVSKNPLDFQYTPHKN